MFRALKYILLVFLILFLSSCMQNLPHATQDQSYDKEDWAELPSEEVARFLKTYNLEVVNAEYVFDKIKNSINKKRDFVIIDAREPEKYAIKTIPFAINIPSTNFEIYFNKYKNILKDKEIIAFCNGWYCEKSPRVSSLLKKKGYKNIKVFQAGMPEWKRKYYTLLNLDFLATSAKNNSAFLVNIDNHESCLRTSIPGSISIPFDDLNKLIGRFPADKNTPIALFTSVDKAEKLHQSAIVLNDNNYKNVGIFAGDFSQLKNIVHKAYTNTIKSKTLDVVHEDQNATSQYIGFIKKGGDEGSVDGEWFLSYYQNLPKNITLVDVRRKNERKLGYIKNSIHISIEENSADDFIANLPKEGYIVFVCSAGGRSLEAYNTVKQRSSKDLQRVLYLDASIKCKDLYCKIVPNLPINPKPW